MKNESKNTYIALSLMLFELGFDVDLVEHSLNGAKRLDKEWQEIRKNLKDIYMIFYCLERLGVRRELVFRLLFDIHQGWIWHNKFDRILDFIQIFWPDILFRSVQDPEFKMYGFPQISDHDCCEFVTVILHGVNLFLKLEGMCWNEIENFLTSHHFTASFLPAEKEEDEIFTMRIHHDRKRIFVDEINQHNGYSMFDIRFVAEKLGDILNCDEDETIENFVRKYNLTSRNSKGFYEEEKERIKELISGSLDNNAFHCKMKIENEYWFLRFYKSDDMDEQYKELIDEIRLSLKDYDKFIGALLNSKLEFWVSKIASSVLKVDIDMNCTNFVFELWGGLKRICFASWINNFFEKKIRKWGVYCTEDYIKLLEKLIKSAKEKTLFSKKNNASLKTQKYGVEIEFTGMPREKAARILAEVLGKSDKRYDKNNIYTYSVIDDKGRKWFIVRDASIAPENNDEQSVAENVYQCELVTPILDYDDIPIIHNVVCSLKEGGMKVNSTCGLHVHISGEGYTARGLRNLARLIAQKEELIFRAIKISPERRWRYCESIADTYFVHKLKRTIPIDTDGIEKIRRIWYEDDWNDISDPYHQSKYYDLNLHSLYNGGKGIEFRFFNSTDCADCVIAYVQFCLALSHYAKTTTYVREYQTTHLDDSSYMRKWLYLIGLTGSEFEKCRFYMTQGLAGESEKGGKS